MLGKRVAAIAVSAMLAVTLCPGIAAAAPLEVGQASNALTTQATKSVYVIDKVTLNITSTYTDANGKKQTQKLSNDYKFTYKKGLLATAIYKVNGGDTTAKFTYDGINLKKSVNNMGTFTYKSVKGKIQSASMKNDYTKNAVTYNYNNAGKLASTTSVNYTKASGSFKKSGTTTVKYTLTKGNPTKVTYIGVDADGKKNTTPYLAYTYDDKDNIKTGRYLNETFTGKMTNTYDGNRLVKRVVKSKTGTYTYTYHYTKASVSSSAVSTINAQQWSLRNNNLNGATGRMSVCPLYW